jgi:hypothetical protein
MKQIICRGGCGRTLEQKHDPAIRWYGSYNGDECVSGICEECYQKEKATK